MSYYWFNRQEILQKAKGRYSIETAAEYYAQNKEAIKEKSNRFKSLCIILLQMSEHRKYFENSGKKHVFFDSR